MTIEQIKETVDKMKHDLWIHGIDADHCSDLYHRTMLQRYEYIINNVTVKGEV
jgi:hypothetical protein